MRYSFFSYRVAGGWLLLSGSLFAAGCKQVCGENVPEYHLSVAQRALAGPYAVGAVWRFRNGAGQVRTYEVRKAAPELIGGGGGSNYNFCHTYYQEFVFADLVRTDTAQTTYRATQHLQLEANRPGVVPNHFLQWHSSSFSLPLDEVDAGQLLLPAATFGGRTYPHVLDRPNTEYPITQHLYLTKADGVVAYLDRYGTLWERQ